MTGPLCKNLGSKRVTGPAVISVRVSESPRYLKGSHHLANRSRQAHKLRDLH